MSEKMQTKNYFDAAKIEELTTGRKIAYSIVEASDLIGVTTQHLRNENQRGKLRFARSVRRILILHTELMRYLEEQVVEPTAA